MTTLALLHPTTPIASFRGASRAARAVVSRAPLRVVAGSACMVPYEDVKYDLEVLKEDDDPNPNANANANPNPNPNPNPNRNPNPNQLNVWDDRWQHASHHSYPHHHHHGSYGGGGGRTLTLTSTPTLTPTLTLPVTLTEP